METERLNGYKFLATYRVEEEGILPGRIILGEREPTWEGGHRLCVLYATAYLPDGDSQWQFGHCFNNRLEASKDYAMRSARGL